MLPHTVSKSLSHVAARLKELNGLPLEHVRKRVAAAQKLVDDGRWNHAVFRPDHRWAYPLGKALAVDEPDVALDSVDESAMTARFKITSVRRDRHGDIVVPDGCVASLANYASNPRIFFSHNSHCLPIASARKDDGTPDLEFEEDCIYSTGHWHGLTEESEVTFAFIARKELQAASIGFLPYQAYFIDPEEESEDADEIIFDFGGLAFTQWDLMEWSVVPIPANADAIRGHLSRGKIDGIKIGSRMAKSLAPYASATPAWSNGATLPTQKNAAKHPAVIERRARWNSDHSKEFDIAGEKLKPASQLYDFASKFIGCPVKKIYQNTTYIPSAKIGSFLSAWRDVLAKHELVDTRNLAYDGAECPPVYDVIQLNSEKSDDFLIDGTCFYGKGTALKFVVNVQPSWAGLAITVYTDSKDRDFNTSLPKKTWEIANTQYNFLKGEAFSLSGKFLPRTKETFDDVFLDAKNIKALRRTLKQLNDKQSNFANRGTMMLGPPGTGKTLSGRILRNEAKATFIWISARDFYYSGAFGGISYAFELAKELAPAILFIEDVDNWLSETSIDLLKTEMDGIGRHAGVWTILTTNFPERMPEALIDRPGRFHDVLKFDLPDAAAREGMLRRWLPDLDSLFVQEAVDETDGYSGAHLYELAHFTKTLQEQDDLPLEEALHAALAKVAEQRDLVTKRHRSKSVYAPTADLSFKSVSQYRAHCGSTPLRRVVRSKATSQPYYTRSAMTSNPSPNATMNENPADTEPKDAEESVQALIFDPETFTEDAAREWLKGCGYSDENFVAGHEADEELVFLQFEADHCEQGTGRRELVAEGVFAVFCKKSGEDRVDGSQATDQPAPENVPTAAATVASVTKRLLADDEDEDEDEEKPSRRIDKLDEEEEEDEAVPDYAIHPPSPEVKRMPHGCSVLCRVKDAMKVMHKVMTDEADIMEHEAVKEYSARKSEELTEGLKELDAMGAEHFPDHWPKDEAVEEEDDAEEMEEDESEERDEDADEEEEDDDDEEIPPHKRSAPQPVVKRMKSGHRAVVRDAAEFLAEHADEENLKRGQKAAVRHHAEALARVYDESEAAPKEEEDEEDSEGMKQMSEALEALKRRWYMLTGQEL